MGASTPPTIIMTSIRQQVLKCYKDNPKISPKNLCKKFPDANKQTLKRYLMSFRKESKRDITGDKNISPKDILYEIFIDKRQPATARVAAIREYNNLLETQPEDKSSDDGFLKWLETQGKLTSTNPSITDTSSITSTSPTSEKDGSTSIKT